MNWNDWVPTLPSFQTWLSIFCSQKYVDDNGADIALLATIFFYVVANAIIWTPYLGIPRVIKTILYFVIDIPLFMGLVHLGFYGWAYNNEAEQHAYSVIQSLPIPKSGDERAYRSGLLWQINTIYSSENMGELGAVRAQVIDELPAYYAKREIQRLQLDKEYEENGFLGWWRYRRGIDRMDTELPPGLAEYTAGPRAYRAVTYATLFVSLALLTLPYHRRLLHTLIPATSPKRAVQLEHEALARKLAEYNRVEMLNGNITFSAAYRGSFTYQAGYIHMGDIKLVVIGGEWVSQGGEIAEYIAPSDVRLRFFRRAQKKSIFD